jgi:hypothetical protein
MIEKKVTKGTKITERYISYGYYEEGKEILIWFRTGPGCEIL